MCANERQLAEPKATGRFESESSCQAASTPRRALMAWVGLALIGISAVAQGQVIYTYEDVPAAPIGTGDNNCPAGGITRTISVPESFNVSASGTVALGIVINHATRDHLQIRLTAPNGNTVVLADGVAADANDNYNVTFGDPHDTSAPLNDGDNDPTSVAGGLVFYRRLVNVTNLTSTLYPVAGSVNGNWTLQICDDTAGTAGTYVRARLTLRDDATTSIPQVCASTTTFDWGTVTTVPPSVDGGPLPLPDGTTITAGEVTMTQVQSVGAPADAQASFRRLTSTNGADPGYYALIMDLNSVAGTDDAELAVEAVRFSFSPPAAGLDFQLLDVDQQTGGSAWEDYVQVIGFNADGVRVPYLHTFPGAAPVMTRVGDWTEADTPNVANTSNNGNVRFRFLEPVASITVGYAAGDEPQNDPVQQVVGIGDPNFCAYDYGDAPSSYGTLLANNGPRHALTNRTRLFLGSTSPDGETDGQPSAGATGDDTSLNNDDADVITFPPPRLPNQGWVCGSFTTNPANNEYCVTVRVTNTTGIAAQLVGWIDFNNDGDFTDAGERSLPDLQSIATTGFTTGNIPDGSVDFSAVLVFSSPAAIPNNITPSMMRVRLTTDPLFFSDVTPPSHLGAVRDGEVVDQAIPINTLPVTLSGFNAIRLGPTQLAVRWNVATEAGTIGYRVLQAGADGQLQDLGDAMVPATGVDSLLPQFYEVTVSSSRDEPLFLEELSSHGRKERFGPYAIGAVSGETLTFTPAPWTLARQQRTQAFAAENQQRRALRAQMGTPAAELRVDRTGMQRVSVAELQAVGVNLSGRDSSLLRLQAGNDFVPLRVVPGGLLTPGSVIEFYGRAVSDSQYTRTRPYLLTAEGGVGLVPGFATESAAPVPGAAADRLRRELALDANQFYSFSAPGSDPWYFDTVQRNGADTGKSWFVQVEGLREGLAGLAVDVWGGLDYPGNLADHRYRVLFNGTVLGERTFDGIRTDTASWLLPEGLLQEGTNEVRIELLQTGFPGDILRVESIRLSAVTTARASDVVDGLVPGALAPVGDGLFIGSFERTERVAACGLACEQFRLSGLPDADVVALKIANGEITELLDAVVTPGQSGFDVMLRPAQLMPANDALNDDQRLLVLSRSQYQQPQLRPAAVPEHPLNGGAAQLILIAPQRYLADAEPLLQARRAEGLTARAVDVEQIYAHYSQGIVDPLAIRAFLDQARNGLATEYVLLVGGDTYDYFDRLQLGSISDIPTIYGRTHPVVAHAPLDQALVDFDLDGSPDLAIGRLPVRTNAELVAVIDRILSAPTSAAPLGLFIAERANAAEASNYAGEMNQVLLGLPAPWQAQAQRVYLDDYPLGVAGVAQARSDIVNGVNSGRSLISYFGHGSPTVWSREQLLQSAQLGTLFSPGSPAPVVSEFGCWGGYFVAPQYNTMSHGWLLSGAGAASAVFASSGLTEHHSDRRMADLLLPLLAQPGVRLGDALRDAKQSLHASEPEVRDVLLGMSLFGDPTMRMPQ